MPHHTENTQLISNNTSNYTLIKILRTSLSPFSALIGTSAYYSQIIASPILGVINALLFSKKLAIDVWKLNQRPSMKNKLITSGQKVLLGLGIISLANYTKFCRLIIDPVTPSELTTLRTTTQFITTPTTTTIDPWPSMLSVINSFDNNPLVLEMDWDTYISLNAYGITNIIGGILQAVPNKFTAMGKITNIITGGTLISSGLAMGINNTFANAYAVPTIIAGVSEVIHNLLPMQTEHTSTEMVETTFTTNSARLINASVIDNSSSSDSIDSLTNDVIYQKQPKPWLSY